MCIPLVHLKKQRSLEGSGSRPASGGEEPRAHGGVPHWRSGEGRTEERARRDAGWSESVTRVGEPTVPHLDDE